MERVFPYFFGVGLILAAIGFLGMIVAAYRHSTRTGILVTLFPPLAIIFATRHLHKAFSPTLMFVGGLLIAGYPAFYTRLVPIDLGPAEKIVNGETHITVTGWDRKDYSFLSFKPQVAVLQMANPDVTDATLRPLKGFRKLRVLDVTETAITDASLPVIASLPALTDLKIRRTKVTDAGFKQHLAGLDSLMLLNVRDTGISKETVKAWKDAKPKRRALQ